MPLNTSEPTLSHVPAADMADKLAAIRDALQAYDFVESALDSLPAPGAPVQPPDCQQLIAVLRIVNEYFDTWMGRGEALLPESPADRKTGPGFEGH